MPANQKPGEPLPDEIRCVRIKRESGDRCNRRRWHDTELCYSHTVPANRKRIRDRATGARVKADLMRYAIEPVADGPEMTGQAQLSIELRRTVAWIAFCEAQVQKLDSEADFVFGLAARERSTSTEEGTGDKGDAIDKHTSSTTERHEARLNVWIERLEWNREHMLKITKQWIDAGYEAARLELERQTVEMFFATMNRAIIALGHDIDDPRVMEVINAAISGVAAGRELTA